MSYIEGNDKGNGAMTGTDSSHLLALGSPRNNNTTVQARQSNTCFLPRTKKDVDGYHAFYIDDFFCL